ILQEQVAEQERALFNAQMTLATRRMTRNPLPVAKSPVGITPIRLRRESNPKSGLKTTQPLDESVESSGRDSEPSLDASAHSTGLWTGRATPKPLDSSVQSNGLSTGLATPQPLDTPVSSTVQKTGLESEQLLDELVHSTGLSTGRALDGSVHSS